MHKRDRLRKVLSVLLSFFLSLCFLGIAFTLEFRFGLTGKRSVNEAMSETGYIAKAESRMTAGLGELLKGLSLPEELAEQMIQEDESYLDMTNYIDAVFDGKAVTLDTSEFQNTFTNVINDYLLEHNISVSEQLDQSITVAKKSAESIYRQYLEPAFAKTLYEFSEKYSHLLTIVGFICFVLAAVIIILLLLMYHYKHHAVQYIVCSMTAAIVLNVITTIGLKSIDLQGKLGVGPDYYVNFLNRYLQGGGNLGIAVSVIFVAVTLGVIEIGRQLKRTIK